MHTRWIEKYRVVLGVLISYIIIYVLLRISHVIVHEGAYYENGIKKFYEHRMAVESSFQFLLPMISEIIHVIFYPLIGLEVVIWHIVLPVSLGS